MEDSPSTLYELDNCGEVLTPEMLLERGLKEDRFRIDRKKLEDMLQVQQQAPGHGKEIIENAEDFFQKVMQQTSTQISWPSKLKIGAKSKKDPHVKIIGKPEAVHVAKDMILKVLDTKKNRVTLKMDVSHSDHSYIIGKGGFKIQQVMEETGCHIHFPDSNRNAIAEKSNQVSIAGEADGVEAARNKIRELLPLVFTFELPGGASVRPGDESGPALQHIQQTYSFNVTFRAIAPGRILVIVRGCQRLLTRLRQGLVLLMEYLTGSKTIPVMGFMMTEIAVQHHSFIMGINESNLQMIMSKTGATILFPNVAPGSINTDGPPMPNAGLLALGPTGPQILQSKSSVIIQGSFDSVCLAWQELLKCLPLVLMFDLKEGQDVDSILVNRLMEMYSISIMVRPKMRENIKSVILRGAERDSTVLFQVRKEILGFEEPVIGGEDLNGPVNAFASVGGNEFNESSTSTFVGQNRFNTDVGSQNDLSVVESLTLLTNIVQQNPQLLGLLSSLTSTSATTPVQQLPYSQPYRPPGSLPYHNYQYNNESIPTVTHPNSRYDAWAKTRQNENYTRQNPVRHNYPHSFLPTCSASSSISGDDTDSGIFDSARSGHTTANSGGQPGSSASSTTSSICNDQQDEVLKGAYSKPTSEAKEGSDSNLSAFRIDYEKKKILATKKIQQGIDENVRIPTTHWSGYGFSKSATSVTLKQQFNQQMTMQQEGGTNFTRYSSQPVVDMSNSSAPALDYVRPPSRSPLEQVPSPFTLSNFWDSMPQHQRQSSPAIGYSSVNNLKQLLDVFDLEQYYELFTHHEIDLLTFLTLSDIDLQQLNVSYTARKRMLAAIAAMREPTRSDFSPREFKAAPGAERRPLFLRHTSVSDGKP